MNRRSKAMFFFPHQCIWKSRLIKHKTTQQKYLTRNLFLKFLLLSTHDTGGIKDLEKSQGAVQKLKLSNTITVPNLFS